MSYFQNRGTVFFFNPSGGQSPAENFYNTWVDMMDDIAGVPGEKTICIDNNGTLIGGSIVPTGTYDLDKITLAGPMDRVQTWTIQNDVIFTNMFHIARNLSIDYTGTTQALCTLDVTLAHVITVEDRCAVVASGGASKPVWQLEGSVAYSFDLFNGSRLGSFATFQDTVKTAGAAVVLNMRLNGQSTIPRKQTLEGDGTDTLNLFFLDTLSTVDSDGFDAEGFGTVTVTTGRDSDATFGPDGDASLSLSIDSGDSTAQESKLVFQDRGANKWELRKDASNDMALYDVAEAHTAVTIKTHPDNLNALVIDDGNVGIRTPPDPSYDFHVLGTNMLLESETNMGLTLEGATGAAASLGFAQNGIQHWILRSDGATNFVLKNSANDNIIAVVNGVTTEAIRINEDGEVGINNTDPSFQLDVGGNEMRIKNSADTQCRISIDSGTSAAQNAELTFRDRGTDKWAWYKGSGADEMALFDFAGGGLNVIVVETSASNADAIRIQSGNVGIGAIPGSFQLDVSGTGRFSGLLDANGGIDINGAKVNSMGVSTLGATGEITTEDLVACTTGGITVTLPTAASAGTGRVIFVKDRDGNAGSDPITVEGNGSETIDGALTYVLNIDYQSVTLVTDGSNWMIV